MEAMTKKEQESLIFLYLPLPKVGFFHLFSTYAQEWSCVPYYHEPTGMSAGG